MTELDRLPPDQRAVLSLVLDRGKSYGEVAEMLAIPETAVRDRAHAALDALASEPAHVSGSRPERPARAAASTPSSPPRSREQHSSPTPASSRLGGALLLGGVLAVIVVGVILLSSGGGKGTSHTSTVSSSTQSSTPASTVKPSLNKTIALASVEPALKATGTAYVLSQSGRHAFYVAARGLPPSSGFFYAVWLYNSPASSAPLGRAPTVGSDGRMQGGGPLPTNAGNYARLIITRETSTHPRSPGQIVLNGAFGLH